MARAVVTLEGLEKRGRPCSVGDCATVAVALGLCQKHYSRQRRHGDPLTRLKPGRAKGFAGSLIERLLSKVDTVPSTGCWRWTGAKANGGYGAIRDDGRSSVRRAHVVAWEFVHGAVPEGLELDHFLYPESCIGPPCCNPDHVRPVTHAENMARSIHAISPTCKRGHPRTDENTYRRPSGRRECRACRREREGSRP